jgi:hypothetical protein
MPFYGGVVFLEVDKIVEYYDKFKDERKNEDS